ncbi:MAG: tetratricopeptide repeat protein [Acidobacteriota bacterium]|nr:tetratricopeptide repeat protein [Acidobacteriota bacterium]
MKRKEKRHLKEDELATTLNKFVKFAKKWTKHIIAGFVAVILICVIILGVKIVKAHNVKKESVLLNQIFEISAELNNDSTKVEELEKLAGKGTLTRIGYLELASYWFEKEEWDKTIECLKRIPERNKDIIYYKAKDLVAQVYIKQKKYEDALKIYDKIEAKKPKNFPFDVILFHKAQALEQKGDIQQATELYMKIRDEFQESYYGYEASQKVAKLEKKK